MTLPDVEEFGAILYLYFCKEGRMLDWKLSQRCQSSHRYNSEDGNVYGRTGLQIADAGAYPEPY
jgi:hypothetical protein